MRPRLGAALGAAIVALALLAQAAIAAPPRPVGLGVIGGDAWRPGTAFDLEWTNPAVGGGPPLAGVHYRLRDPLGETIAEAELSWVTKGIAMLSVPPVPGTYTAEVWLEDTAGAQGPPATATLRFDDRRPGSIAAPQVPAWIGRTAFPLSIHLGPPAEPAPLSGIGGYAVAIDSSPGGSPCAALDRCSEAETTLRGGPGGDTLSIPTLPEGTSHLHAVAVSGAGMKSAAAAHATLRVDTTDPLTRLQGVPGGWVSHPVRLTATATDAGSGMEPGSLGLQPIVAIRVGGNMPAVAAGDSVATTVFGDGTHAVAYYARDAAGNVNDGGGGNGLANRPPGTAIVRIDREPPDVAFAGSQDPADPELIRARVGDPLSGRDLSRGWIGIRRAGSGDRFEPLPAAPPGDGELRARWDSGAYPTGEYEFRAVAYDAAGNGATTSRRAGGNAMTLSSPLKTPTALRAGFSDQRASKTVRFGRGARLSGRLTGAPGVPLVGKEVRVVERFAAGTAPATRVSTALTGPGGSFSIHLAPGPSREIEASFEGSPTLGRATGPPLRLRVRSRVRLGVSAAVARVGGAPLVFRGCLAATPGTITPGGRAVQLQFRLPGLEWAEFRTVQTDRRGRFRYAYRFSDDDSRGARFQFRAYVPAQDGWPYEPGGSWPVAVRGR